MNLKPRTRLNIWMYGSFRKLFHHHKLGNAIGLPKLSRIKYSIVKTNISSQDSMDHQKGDWFQVTTMILHFLLDPKSKIRSAINSIWHQLESPTIFQGRLIVSDTYLLCQVHAMITVISLSINWIFDVQVLSHKVIL